MDDDLDSGFRYDIMRFFIEEGRLKKGRILDMASGCGTFVFSGLKHGYDVYGIEPERWKHEFNIMKAREKKYPDPWLGRFLYGLGESLPFKNESFDVIFTYQTLEHVQSYQQCIAEFTRVLKRGGYLFIWCPDYTSFFEGHYRLPMLPLMSRKFFIKYLSFLKRPAKGLDSIQYITRKDVLDCLRGRYTIYDAEHLMVKAKIKEKIGIKSDLLSFMYRFYVRIRNVFRSENSVKVVAVKAD